MPIRAVTFDLDNTLWDTPPVIARAEQVAYDWLAAHHPCVAARFDIAALRALRAELGARNAERAHDLAFLRRETYRCAADDCGADAGAVADQAFAVFDAERHNLVFYADVFPALERLARRYRLGALSNGTASMTRLGYGHLFEVVLSAIDVGRAKPHGAIFERALAQFDLAPHEIVHVGDDPEHDVLGAAAAGWRTVWINRTGANWILGTRPDAEITSLAELEPLLSAW